MPYLLLLSTHPSTNYSSPCTWQYICTRMQKVSCILCLHEERIKKHTLFAYIYQEIYTNILIMAILYGIWVISLLQLITLLQTNWNWRHCWIRNVLSCIQGDSLHGIVHLLKWPLPGITCISMFPGPSDQPWLLSNFREPFPDWVFSPSGTWEWGEVVLHLNKRDFMPDLFPRENKQGHVCHYQGTFASWKGQSILIPFLFSVMESPVGAVTRFTKKQAKFWQVFGRPSNKTHFPHPLSHPFEMLVASK